MQTAPLDSIRDLFARQQLVEIDDEVLRRVAENIDVADFQERLRRVPPPLNFANLPEEINLLVINHLLNIGAHFSDRVNIASQETLSDVILFGVLGMFIAHQRLDASFLAGCANSDVSSLFNIPMHIPVEIQPGITMDQPGPLAGLVELLSETMQQTGRKLAEQHYTDLGTAALQLADSNGSVLELVSKLATLLEGFNDVETIQIDDTVFQIPFHKNAQRLAADLYHRFHERSDKFAFADYASLYAAPSASAITTLVQMGVLKPKLSDPAEVSPGNEGEAVARVMAQLGATPDACTITRAAAVVAIHRIAESVGNSLQPFDLSLYCEQYNDFAKAQYVPCVADKW